MKQRMQILLIGLALVGLWIWRRLDGGSTVPGSSGSFDDSGANFRGVIKPERGSPKQPELNYSPLPKPDGVLSRDVASVGLPSFDSGAVASVMRAPSIVSRDVPITQAVTRAVREFVAPTANTNALKSSSENYTPSKIISSRGWVR